MVYCTCKEWIEYAAFEKGLWAYLSVHGFRYTGPYFNYCPFCGSEIESDEPSQDL